MSKTKKRSSREAKVMTKKLSGKIIKVKNSEIIPDSLFTRKMQVKVARTPLEVSRQKGASNESFITPIVTRRMSKWTSTPITTTNKSTGGYPINVSGTSRQSKQVLSPIMVNIGKNMTKVRDSVESEQGKQSEENAHDHDVQKKKNKSLSTPSEILEKTVLTRAQSRNSNSEINKPTEAKKINSAPIILSRRRTFGTRRVETSDKTMVLDAPNQYKKNKCSELRVRVTRCPLETITANESLDSTKTCHPLEATLTTESTLTKSHNNTFIEGLRADWSSKTLEETQTPNQIKNSHRLSLRPVKRRLTTLIEISFDERTTPATKLQVTPTKATNQRKINEDAYSSSAEFESDNEKENRRSKRAPTWKDLSQNTLPSISFTPINYSPSVRVLRLRKPSKKTILDSKKAIMESNKTPESGPLPANKNNCNEINHEEGEKPNSEVTPPNKNKAPNNESVPRYTIMSSQESNENETAVQRAKKLLSYGSSVRRNGIKNSSTVPIMLDTSVPYSSKSPNLLNKSNSIEEIISSSVELDDDGMPIDSVTHSNNTHLKRKFFNSRIENKIVEPKPVKPTTERRPITRKKKRESIYDFLSQSPSSDSTDPAADVIKKMIDTGKVTVAKHSKARGRPIVVRQRKLGAKKNLRKAEKVFANPRTIVKKQALQEKAVNKEQFNDDDSNFDGANFCEDEPERNQSGFSELARSTMIKQAGKNGNTPQRKMITDRKKLLAIAQKFVGQSTPVKLPSTSANMSELSSIAGNTSPWRADDDNLPNLFYFNRNSDNLPSFSSDHIISTPRKNKSKSTSSFSSNDSNMENIAPPSVQTIANENRSPTGINTRRALSYRSPLKAINILEVINLPSLNLNINRKDTTKENIRRDQTNKSIDASESSFFGFEDMIEDDENDLTNVTVDQLVISNQQQLKEKLQSLKHLRPERTAVATTSKKNNHINPVFDDPVKQRTVKQMFCSTMIENQQQSEAVDDSTQQGDIDLSNLFKDPEPETSFNQLNPRRTYSRPFKRKRKLRHNFVMFMDSDASEDDDEGVDKSNEKKSKKRHIKDRNEAAELNKFANEFNEMCKEVDEYELVVE